MQIDSSPCNINLPYGTMVPSLVARRNFSTNARSSYLPIDNTLWQLVNFVSNLMANGMHVVCPSHPTRPRTQGAK